jgi:hypothetical protein
MAQVSIAQPIEPIWANLPELKIFFVNFARFSQQSQSFVLD